MSENEKTKNNAPRFSIPFIPFHISSFLMGCNTMFFLVAIVLVGALILGLANNLLGGLNWLNDIFGRTPLSAPENIFIPSVERVQALSELTTTRYSYADVQGGQRDMPGWLSALYGDSVVMVTVGIIEAGIDVSQITQEDIIFDESTNTLSLSLPAPTLQNCFLDEAQSYIVERNTAAFGVPLNNLEDAVRQNALHDYRDKAIEEGILATAQTEAEATMREFLSIVVGSDTNIRIIFEAAILSATLPATCQ